ncbi:MAG: 2-oxoglutarate dehydrogenase E1 component, partial [Chloroflexota bacterium]
MSAWDAYYGPNAGYVEELYDRYCHNPESVDAATRAIFQNLGPPELERPSSNGATATASAPRAKMPVQEIVAAARLARLIREYGHLASEINPLGPEARPGEEMLHEQTHGLTAAALAALPGSIVFPEEGVQAGTAQQAIQRLRAMYSGPSGYEFDHLQQPEERAFLHHAVENDTFQPRLTPDQRRGLLSRLSQVEGFERFLNTAFQGQKRFSIEGSDTLVLILDDLLAEAAASGTQEVLIGMAHRGRLNVLAHILGKPYAAIFSEFHSTTGKGGERSEGSPGTSAGWTGDVKYHLGWHKAQSGSKSSIQITLSDNPSHLEFVNPVVEGSARAAQDSRDHKGPSRQNVDRAIALTVHGDAAFPGEGVVAETLNLSRLPGYQTGGTIHIIVNNQIGFTATPDEGRSTLYASDLAKGFEIPIIHVNADEPEAVLHAARVAFAYRQRYHRDFLIDLVGYRRWGHNEGDEPAFTQPLMYDAVRHHPTARARYAEKLVAEGVLTADEAQAILDGTLEDLRREYDAMATQGTATLGKPETAPRLTSIDTKVPADELVAINESLLARPETLHQQTKLERLLGRRREALHKDHGIDWAHAEVLAFGSILADGTPIRLTGQDTARGTFSQRHLVLHDPETGEEYIPLQALPQARASFDIHNSPLTEDAALGFEYGYSVHSRDCLVLWEAQYGDFANAAQVVIDQFIAAARAKWRQQPALALLLPHGYEGQGPEHSSARLERYLQLAADDNIRVANCTTAAQY